MTGPFEVYQELLSAVRPAPGQAYRSFSAPPGMAIRAFIDGASSLPGVALIVPKRDVPPGMQFPKMKGAEHAIHGEGSGEAGQVAYEIRAAEAPFSAVFIELASKLITDAGNSESPREALTLVARRLAAWARFFDARDASGLSRQSQLGLIGELVCLRTLARVEGLSRAIRAWSGPSGTTHDFQTRRGGIEVKLTTTSTPERFRITSERQLDEEPLPKLVLCAISAQEHPAGELGLSDLVARLRAEAAADAPAEAAILEERLTEVGYADEDSDRYQVRVTVRAVEFARVKGSFPRVRPADLRPGVFAVSYEIPRSAVSPYIVPESEAGEIIRGVE